MCSMMNLAEKESLNIKKKGDNNNNDKNTNSNAGTKKNSAYCSRSPER